MWCADIEKDTTKNRDWRQVVHTSKHLQVVLMSVPPGEELGWEKHGQTPLSAATDQFFRFDTHRNSAGLLQVGGRKGRVDEECEVVDGMAAVVPAGKWHNLINISERPLNFYTIYAPPHHPPNTVDRTKSDERRLEKKARTHGSMRK